MEDLGINLIVDNTRRIPRSIVWLKPLINFIKLNVDIVNINSVWGWGDLIRDSNGNYILGFVGPIPNCDVKFSINYAILYGLRLCLSLDLINLVVEEFVEHLNCTFSEVHAKGNACANAIAKWGYGLDSMVDLPVSNLPHLVTGMLGLDNIGSPYVT
ncbi:hypothetical protein M5K25_022613 [Dendrobium thyrsiflorum]|uniref:RNase H type-1 domain-containing protein n=1 Tax=Dendrobium thyrsiflorum TaxID=117978 RepID=A0ABD0U6M5_DENTH